MSLLSKSGLLERIRRGKEARSRLVESNLAKGIAYQIRATRESRKMTQADLASAAGMTQNNLSRLESPEYGKQTISSLKRIADALDVALVVRLVPFSQYVDWLSATPYMDEGIRPEALAVPSFEEEEISGRHEKRVLYYELHLPTQVAVPVVSTSQSEFTAVTYHSMVSPANYPEQESKVA
jgi:transcriptional regulator with XRE-family HTH domain